MPEAGANFLLLLMTTRKTNWDNWLVVSTTLLDRDIGLARTRLVEGERLASEAQHELTAILEQLRPGSYLPPPEADVNLECLLSDYIGNWTLNNSPYA